MDHIFGDSDDIQFGTQSSTPSSKGHVSRVDDFSDLSSYKSPKRVVSKSTSNTSYQSTKKQIGRKPINPSAPRDIVGGNQDNTMHEDIPALTRLVKSMKNSFLSKENDAHLARVILLSNPTEKDPLFLIREDDATVLVGSGFGTTQKAGKTYTTFPDMRLVFSEKERIRAWIITDDTIDISIFQDILPTLDFPPIYGTREVIAKFRNNIKDAKFIESCRFFELFTDTATRRKFGSIECMGDNGGVTFFAGGIKVGFSHLSGQDSDTNKSIGLTESGFSLDGKDFSQGEIVTILHGKIDKDPMKFTFDTFYIDQKSIGILAGYTLDDREQLASNGVLIFTLEEDTRARTITGHIFIDSRGFVHAYEMMAVHKEILKGIRATYEKLLIENPRIERGDLVQSLRREITKYCYITTGRTPMVMPIIIER